ncbi:hypothetical protein SAMN05421821_10878 [Mucilaginibacter lappiensis]|uniref:Uncharacterized protein n=1 Tax=Mucilaginibacter lappiensis TaxID=354630 RepID=A0ABR6PM88_9SPHI|nr:hypothetical protein [Mucilaginibacter lappiensis]SIR52624.1 hypothetical protein SAMN05421821_10878 [Mucilaginibacter lappiensis]
MKKRQEIRVKNQEKAKNGDLKMCESHFNEIKAIN